MLPRGLYLHIPFCRSRCAYCHFVTTPSCDEKIKEKFFRVLDQEIQAVKKRWGALSFDTVYFGGGSPSVLSSREMERLISLVQKEFEIRPNPEWTCEINPGDVDMEKLETYASLGINRISLGVQAFQEALLKSLGRRHSVRDVVQTVETLYQNGFDNFSLDLMLRLPGQSLQDFRESLFRALQLRPKQISIYDLEVHEDSVFGAMKKQGNLKLPDEDTHERMYQMAESLLGEAGYFPYELTNFARPGFESKHNLIYWHNQEYLGLGPGAFSYLNDVRFQFASSVERWFEKIESADFKNDVEDFISPEKKELETLLTGLRLQEGVDLDRFVLIREKINPKIQEFIGSGLLEHDQRRIRLTSRGRCLFETLALELCPA